MARGWIDYIRRLPMFTHGALLALTLVCIGLVICFHPADGSSSVFGSLLYLPLILVVLTCKIEFVLTLDLLLSTAVIVSIWQAFHSANASEYQIMHASEAMMRLVVLNAFALIGGLYARRMRGAQEQMLGTQEQITRRLKETDSLLNISLWIETSGSLEDAIDIILLALHQIRPYTFAALYFCDEDRATLIPQGTRAGSGDRLPLREPIDLIDRNMIEVLSAPTYATLNQLDAAHPLAKAAEGVPYFAALPLFLNGHHLDGLLCIAFDDPQVLPEEDYQRMEDFSRRIAVPLQKARQEDKLRYMAFTDAMTGLQNYRAFRTQLEEELRRANRYEHPLGLLLMDLDNFKRVNDVHGHPVGDRLLAHTAAVLRASLRDTDLPTRYGGEEFAILCPETDLADAALVAERIRAAIECSTFSVSESVVLSITVSIGVAAFPTEADSEATLVHKADNALYQAKKEGRNRVRLAASAEDETTPTGCSSS